MTPQDDNRLKAATVAVVNMQGFRDYMSKDDVSLLTDQQLQFCMANYLIDRIKGYING